MESQGPAAVATATASATPAVAAPAVYCQVLTVFGHLMRVGRTRASCGFAAAAARSSFGRTAWAARARRGRTAFAARTTCGLAARHGLVVVEDGDCESGPSCTLEPGPWVHVGSDLAHVGLARAGDRLTTRGRVGRLFTRKGREYAELDALVVAEGSRPILHVRHTAIYRLPEPGPD